MTVQTIPTPGHAPSPVSALAPAGAITEAQNPGLLVLQEWVTAASNARALVLPLVSSAFVPDAYKPRIPNNADENERRAAYDTAVANATSAVLLGISLGLDPLTALQQIYLVKGRPGMYTKMKVALAQARGHRIWDEVYSAERAVVCGQRAGTDDVVRIEITMEDAKRAEWTSSNENYRKTPADMLWSRAAGRVVDRIAADVLFGIASIEDLDDAPEPARQHDAPRRVTASDIVPTAPKAVTATATPPAAASGEQPPAAASAITQDPPAPLDSATWDRINGRFRELGVTGDGQKAARLRVIADIVQRPIEQGRDLTADEGQLVLDNLAGEAGARVVAATLRPDDAPLAAQPTPAPAGDEFGGADPDADTEYDPNDPSTHSGYGQGDDGQPPLPGEDA